MPFNEIDKVKWNSCVHYAVNSEVSGYYWWLKAVVKEWDAVIEGDYESVLPLFFKRDVWGRKVLYHPPLLGKIGIQSIHILSRKRIVSMLEYLPEVVGMHVKLNEMNVLPPDFPHPSNQFLAQRILLNKPLQTLRAAYANGIPDLIQTDMPAGYFFQVMMKPEEIVEFCKNTGQLPYGEHEAMRVFYNLLHRGTLVSNVILDENHKPVALLVITYHLKKIKVLLSAQNKKGKELKAIYRLYDHLINLHQNKPMMFEFFPGDRQIALDLGAEEYVYWEINSSDVAGKWSKWLEKIAVFN